MPISITLNGKPCTPDLSGKQTFADLIEMVAITSFEPNETITAISVNGKAIQQEELESMTSSLLENIQLVEITTLNPRVLAIKCINSMEAYLERLIPGLEQAADKFRIQSEDEANRFFVQIVDGLKTFVDLIDTIGENNLIDTSDIKIDGTSFSEQRKALEKIIGEMFAAQTVKDWVRLADLLEYELAGHITSWRSAMPAIREAIA